MIFPRTWHFDLALEDLKMVVWRLGDVKDAMMIPTLKWFVNYKFYFRTYIAVEPSTIVFCWNLLKLCCWNVLVLLLKCYSLSPLCLFKYFDFLVGSPWVPRNPMGLGDGRKTSPAHGDGHGDGFTIFSWGWVWEGKTWWVSSPLPSWVLYQLLSGIVRFFQKSQILLFLWFCLRSCYYYLFCFQYTYSLSINQSIKHIQLGL